MNLGHLRQLFELKKLADELGGAKRPSLEIWFAWHNGSKNQPVNLLPLGGTISIDEAISDRRAMQDLPFVNHNRRRDVKILDDGCGDGFFVDLSTSPPKVYYEMLEDPRPSDFGTLKQFITFIDRVHAAAIASLNEKGVVVFDLNAYDKLEDEYRESLQSR